MIKITKQGEEGASLEPLGYIKGRGFVGRAALRLTRYLRAINVERYMSPAKRHLDIGCGDGFFLHRSGCEERFGLDKLLGDEVTDRLDFPDDYFDYVTMLAVIEHIPEPEALAGEISRVLRPGGRLVITTPRKAAEPLMRLYARGVEEEHESYFDYERIEKLFKPMLAVVGHHTFIFGLNQVFCLETAAPSDR